MKDYTRERTFISAIRNCEIGEAIYRASDPTRKYFKNYRITLVERVPFKDQNALDWKILNVKEEVIQ